MMDRHAVRLSIHENQPAISPRGQRSPVQTRADRSARQGPLLVRPVGAVLNERPGRPAGASHFPSPPAGRPPDLALPDLQVEQQLVVDEQFLEVSFELAHALASDDDGWTRVLPRDPDPEQVDGRRLPFWQMALEDAFEVREECFLPERDRRGRGLHGVDLFLSLRVHVCLHLGGHGFDAFLFRRAGRIHSSRGRRGYRRGRRGLLR